MPEVVVGVDGSEGAAEALIWAAREASLRDLPLTAVMAWGFLDQHHTIVGERFDPSYGEPEAKAALDAAVDSTLAADRAVDVQRRVTCDLAARALLDSAAGAELLVVGARGLGGFRGLLLGSVSQRCLAHAPCPVAVVRSGAALPKGGTIERIVVGVDGSETSQHALRWALQEGRLRQAAVQVVHAWQYPYLGGYPMTGVTFDPARFEEGGRQVLDSVLEAADTSDLPAPLERVLVCGSGATAILDTAKGADLVVVGSRGLGGLAGLLLGSVSHQVTHHAAFPVVVVPPGA